MSELPKTEADLDAEGEDPQARFDVWWLEHLPQNRSLAARYARRVGVADSPDDVLQNAYVRVRAAITTVRSAGALASFVRRAIFNCAVDTWRERTNRGALVEEIDVDDDVPALVVERSEGPMTALTRVQAQEVLLRAITQVEVEVGSDRIEAFLLYYERELTDREIGEALDVSESTARNYRNEARKKLQVVLREQFGIHDVAAILDAE